MTKESGKPYRDDEQETHKEHDEVVDDFDVRVVVKMQYWVRRKKRLQQNRYSFWVLNKQIKQRHESAQVFVWFTSYTRTLTQMKTVKKKTTVGDEVVKTLEKQSTGLTQTSQ